MRGAMVMMSSLNKGQLIFTKMQQKLSIVDFGPQETIVVESFNMQSNGEAAMWLITDNATRTTAVIFNGTELQTTYGNSSFITAIVTRQYYQTAGTYELY